MLVIFCCSFGVSFFTKMLAYIKYRGIIIEWLLPYRLTILDTIVHANDYLFLSERIQPKGQAPRKKGAADFGNIASRKRERRSLPQARAKSCLPRFTYLRPLKTCGHCVTNNFFDFFMRTWPEGSFCPRMFLHQMSRLIKCFSGLALLDIARRIS